jgi:hypothetical protein
MGYERESGKMETGRESLVKVVAAVLARTSEGL